MQKRAVFRVATSVQSHSVRDAVQGPRHEPSAFFPDKTYSNNSSAVASGFPAFAQQRVALVIGNSDYKEAPPLPNPVNDATAIAALLESAGFQVVLRRDVSINDMRRALREFSDATRMADVAVVYFGGHGIEIDGENYLLPVDAGAGT